LKFKPQDYLKHIAEHVESWSYIKFCYLKDVGWKGFEEGPESGVYAVAPLARLNASDGMATPKAQQAYEQFYQTLGGKPAGTALTLDTDDLGQVLAPSPHYAGFPEMIKLAEELQLDFPREIKIFAIEVTDPYTIGGELTSDVKGGLEELILKVTEQILSWQTENINA
jgi:hypothetical protein